MGDIKVERLSVRCPSTDPTVNMYERVPVMRLDSLPDLRKTVEALLIEMNCCNKQLIARGATEGHSVRMAREAVDAASRRQTWTISFLVLAVMRGRAEHGDAERAVFDDWRKGGMLIDRSGLSEEA